VPTAETIEAALERLSGLHPGAIDLSLDRINRLLEALGRPQERLPPTIHIAGTNGKGSTAAFLKAVSEAAGERCHLYTSPHLVRFNERIIVAGEIIDDDRLKHAFARCETANGARPITFFEITTAAAFLLFSEISADRLILETGLGGRLDATNVIDAPQCTIITPVSHDHQALLGDTLEAIAGEKAGIIKRGAPLVLAPQRPEAEQVIMTRAHALTAPVHAWGRHFRACLEHARLIFKTGQERWSLNPPALAGPHQRVNAGVAAAAARICGYGPDAISRGIAQAHWPARLQRLTEGPLAERVRQARGELWLDGGHNLAAAHALAASLKAMQADRTRPLVLICAFSVNKDAEGYLAVFKDLASLVIATGFHRGREGARPPDQIADAARRSGLPARMTAYLHDAVEHALAEHPASRILICGSLYLAGQVLALAQGQNVHSAPG